ncbi:MAG: hypothetical protein WKF80_07810 [Thermomicrobiales bacterium]
MALPVIPRRSAMAREATVRPRAAWLDLDRAWLVPLLVLFLAKQVLLVGIIGPFTGHDEVDHFYYIQRLAAGQGLGEVGAVLLPEAAAPYEEYVADFPYNAEVIQPPLYHVTLAGLARLVPGEGLGDLFAFRAVSAGLGLAALALTYAIAAMLFPSTLFARAGTVAFVAFQPQFSFEAAIVNHDILVIALFTAVGYLCQRGLRDGFGPGSALAIGLLNGVGLWTKVSHGLVLPMVGAALLIAAWDRRGQGRRAPSRQALARLVGHGALATLLPIVLVSPWFLRSYRLYGDPSGAERLREIPEYGEQASTYPEMVRSAGFWQGRLEDFWANYGWRQVPFDAADYQLLWAAWALAGLGLGALAVRGLVGGPLRLPPVLTRLQRRALAMWGVGILSVTVGVLYVGTIQFTQSRFAFPAMAGFALWSTAGWAVWVPARLRNGATVVLALAFLLLTVSTAVRFLIPFYHGPGGGWVPAS